MAFSRALREGQAVGTEGGTQCVLSGRGPHWCLCWDKVQDRSGGRPLLLLKQFWSSRKEERPVALL